MVVTIPGIVIVVLVVLLVVMALGRQEPRPPLTPTRAFWVGAAVCFALAAGGVTFTMVNLVALGLLLYVCGYLVSPR